MVGIVVSNSILIVEFTHRLREDGMSVREAVALACRVRLRPVLMTSLATLIGLIPMALKLGTGSEAYAPLARAIIGGLAVRSCSRCSSFPRRICWFTADATRACRHEEASEFCDSGGSAGADSAGADDDGCGADGAEESSCDRELIAAGRSGEAADRPGASARYPFASASVTAVDADDASRMAAGGLNNPVFYSRMATGVNVTQNLLDFGRTSHLIDSSKSAAAAASERVRATKADVILAVRRAYYNSLRADTVLQVAQATVEARQNVVDQVSELVKADLKSSLDLSFANTNWRKRSCSSRRRRTSAGRRVEPCTSRRTSGSG